MEKKTHLKQNLIPHLLNESQNNEDLTIICKNGKFCVNNFLFASIFPGLTSVIEEGLTSVVEESPAVTITDVCVREMIEFFNSVYQQDTVLRTSESIFGLLQWRKTPQKYVKENIELTPDVIKHELEDDYIQEDFNYDIENGDNYDDKQDLIQLTFSKHKEKDKNIVNDIEDDNFKNFSDSGSDEDEKKDKGKKGTKKRIKSDSCKGRKIRKYRVKNNGKICAMRFEYNELKCFICDISFRNEGGLWTHVFWKHGPHQQQKCKDCDEIFDNPGQFDSHKKRVHGQKVSCPDCGKLMFKNMLNTHIKSIHGGENYACDQCGKQFASRSYLKTHLEKKHGDETKKVFSTSKKLSSKNEGDLAAECDAVCRCEVKFSNVKEKIDHYRVVHLGHAQCPKCLKIMKKERIENNSHMCQPYVKKKYVKKKPVKPIKCEICNETFNSFGGKLYHKRKVHEADVSCELCGKVFDSDLNLATHIKNTHREKAPCQICGAVVKHMDYHIAQNHTEDSQKKCQCQYCGKGFTERQKLDRHVMSIHLKLKPYNCRYGCDIAYNDYSNRNQHEKKKHGCLFTEIS